MSHPFQRDRFDPGILSALSHAVRADKLGRPLAGLCALTFCSFGAHAQLSCSLGHITERIAPEYPLQLQGHILEGSVTVLATFAPDGRVTGSKAVSGPSALRFAADSYVHGWRAEKSDATRQCTVQVEFQFDGSQGVCNTHTEVRARPEHIDDTHVLVHLNCDLW